MIEEVSEAVKVCRKLRYEDHSAFDDVLTEELEVVARGLRAVAYSCTEGAKLLERIRKERGNPVPAPGKGLEVREPVPGVRQVIDHDAGTVAHIIDVEDE